MRRFRIGSDPGILGLGIDPATNVWLASSGFQDLSEQ